MNKHWDMHTVSSKPVQTLVSLSQSFIASFRPIVRHSARIDDGQTTHVQRAQIISVQRHSPVRSKRHETLDKEARGGRGGGINLITSGYLLIRGRAVLTSGNGGLFRNIPDTQYGLVCQERCC